MLTTFGIKCGIAEYAAYLARALRAAEAEVRILANERDGFDLPGQASMLEVDGAKVQTAWFYDHLRWKDSRIDLECVARALDEDGCPHLNIQYHPGFYKEPQLLALVEFARGIGRTVSVTLHNPAQGSPELLRAIAGHGVTMLVHKRKEAARLAALTGGSVRYLPMGVLDHAVSPQPAASFVAGSRPPVIATFGFLRAHKGFIELIRSLPLLRRVFPGTRLIAQTALYPSTDSVEYLADVRKQIAAEGLTECIELDHEYHPIGAVIDRLASADLIVLPYAASDEGGSGSLANALAARRPLVLTRAEIFDELMQCGYVVDGNAPALLAVAIGTVLASAPLRALLEQSAVAAATEAGWATVARQMLAVAEMNACGR